MPRRKTKNGWLYNLNEKVKRYQVLISIIIGIIGLLAVYFAFIGNKLSRQQEERDQIKNIHLETVYASNGVDLLSVNFSAKSDEVLIKGYELILPSDFPENIERNHFSNVWKTYPFCQGLLEISSNHLDIQSLEQTISGPENYEDCYPLAISFKYIFKGKEREALNIYKVHFKIYEKGVLHIRAFELLSHNESLSKKKLIRKLDKINGDECLAMPPPPNSQASSDYRHLKKFYAPLLTNIEYAKKPDTLNIYISLPNRRPDSTFFILPLFIADTLHYNIFHTNLLFLLDNIDSLHTDFHAPLRKIEQFILKHPRCTDINYSCISTSGWFKNDVKREWILLNNELLRLLKERIEEFMVKYNYRPKQ